jgi:hypothetical protein
MTTATIRLLIDTTELAEAQEASRDAELEVTYEPKAQAVDPLTAVLIAGAVLAVAKFVIDVIDHLKGGVVIDQTQGGPVLVKRDRSVPYGWAVVIATGGAVSIHVHDAPKDASERLLSQIVEGVFTNAEELAKAGRELIGADRVKETVA